MFNGVVEKHYSTLRKYSLNSFANQARMVRLESATQE